MDSPDFPTFLDHIGHTMKSKPKDAPAGVEVDLAKIQHDLAEFALCAPALPMCDRLKLFINLKQDQLTSGLTSARLPGFEHFPRFTQLTQMATEGLKPFLHPEFIPNKGVGDFERPATHHRLRHTIAQHLRKLQDKNQCFIIDRSLIEGTDNFHLSALHIASKAADPKGRPCTDANHSGLNAGTDMDAITAHLGQFTLPHLRRLAQLMATAQEQGDTLAHKTDVTAAFNNMKLSPEAALLQTFCVGTWVVIPFVAGFGWCAAPAFYNVIASAICWAHNGGLSGAQLDSWALALGHTPHPRSLCLTNRSFTYVDDSCGRSSYISAPGDMLDFKVIIQTLLGLAAYNAKKTEGPAKRLTIIGWDCDFQTFTIQPGLKGRCKLYYWVFRGLHGSNSITLHHLQSAIGTLRWYSAVIPLASTHVLQHILATRQRQLLHTPCARPFCILTARPTENWIGGSGSCHSTSGSPC